MTDTAQMRAVNPVDINIPNISQAILVEGGKLLFLSGHVPLGRMAGLRDHLSKTNSNEFF